jgi:serine/threonine protein kinase
MKWMALSSTEEYHRVSHHAKLFLALRKCLRSLTQFYMNLSHTPPFVDYQPHPRYFPYPTSFIPEGGETTDFRYLKSLEEHAACVTYLAEEIPKETGATGVPGKMVVKFVARYGEEVHRFLARNGHAPALRYYGPLPNTQLSGAFPEPAQGASSDLQLRSDIMRMVVMDYIEARDTRDKDHIPQDARQQIRTILELLHEAGYVFGDLRSQNILFDAYGKVKLIDFNWCGRYKRDNTENQINDGGDGHEDFARYPLSMSRVEGMWAEGMEPLEYILPDHDRRMFEKLPYP